MTTKQSLVDYLLSAGGNYLPDSDLRLFYIDQKDSDFVLSYRDYAGSSLGPQKKVTDGVKPNSSAAYIHNSKFSYVICVSPSSTLRALEFDEDEDDWVDSTSFEKSAIHPSGKLASVNDEENVFIFFQDPAGQLILTQGLSSIQSLPANAVSSTPLSAAIINNSPTLFYISVDNFVHSLTYKGGNWVDAIFAQESFKTIPKHFVAYPQDDGVIDVFGISENSALVLISSKGDKSVLGKVEPDGKFVPGTTEESGIIMNWPPLDRCVCM